MPTLKSILATQHRQMVEEFVWRERNHVGSPSLVTMLNNGSSAWGNVADARKSLRLRQTKHRA